jgi:YD repeat-containing protein
VPQSSGNGVVYQMTGGTAYDDVRIYPSGSQMTTFTYNPLVGMTSSTDPKGETTYYEYDNFQRLMNIKDKDGNVIKHMTYHYKGQ